MSSGATRWLATPGVTAIQPVHLSEADSARIVRLCRERNVILATDAGPADVRARLDEGYRLISAGWDFEILRERLSSTLAPMREAIR